MAISGQAFAFPLLVAGAGAGILGVMFLPLVFLIGLGWIWFVGRRGLVALLATTAIVSGALTYAYVTPSWTTQTLEALSRGETAGETKIAVRFEFLDEKEQGALKQALTAEEFIQGFVDDRYSVVWLDKSRERIFKDLGNRIAIEDVSDDPSGLVALVSASSKPVVLIDETGGIAGSVARDLDTFLGIKTSFVQGGTSGLNDELWKKWAIKEDPQALPFESWREQIASAPGTRIISLVVLEEFLIDGWMHGDTVSPLAGYIAGIDQVAKEFAGTPLLISGAENHFSGHTWLLVHKLRAMGLDVSYIEPTQHEKLVKPPYVAPYQGSATIMPLSESMLIADILGEITYLDFRRQKEKPGAEPMYGPVLSIGMDALAQGRLTSEVDKLDLNKRYMGVAYDKRTLYHSVLAGEAITKRGGKWLGVAIHPGALKGEVERLEFTTSPITASLIAAEVMLGKLGESLIEMAAGQTLALLCCLAVLIGLSHQMANTKAFLLLTVIAQAVATADGWLTPETLTLTVTITAVGLGYLLGYCAGRTIPRKTREQEPTPVLPDKIRLLIEARRLGFHTLDMVIVSNNTYAEMAAKPFYSSKGHIVRSAAHAESGSSSHSGVFESLIVNPGEDVWPTVRQVLSRVGEADDNAHCFIQPLIKNAVFGVAMFGSGPDAHMVIGEYGLNDSVTAGRRRGASMARPLWDVEDVPEIWSAPFRALLDLNKAFGATGIEFAITECGRFCLLQVSIDTDGRNALPVIMAARGKKVMIDPLVHQTALEAAVYAAFAMPGEQYALANCRLIVERSMIAAMAVLANDGQALLGSFNPLMLLRLPGHKLQARFAGLHEGRLGYRKAVIYNRNAQTSELISYVKHEIFEVQQLYGRFSRLTTLAGEISGSRFGVVPDSSIEEIKRACSEAFIAELDSLRPVLDELDRRGQAELLTFVLNTSLGLSIAAELRPEGGKVRSVVKVEDALMGVIPAGSTTVSWSVPDGGMAVYLSGPHSFKPGDALFIHDTDIKHLPLLHSACAVVATNGSALSHLMQHARRLQLPYVVGAFGDHKQADRGLAIVKPNGEVQFA